MRRIRVLLIDDKPGELAAFVERLQERCQRRSINLLVDPVQNAPQAMDALRVGNPYDLVLLDIEGVKYEDVLRDVGDRYPYLPIVMFSRQADPDQIIHCIDLGARSFIFKLDLMIGARPRAPLDVERDEQNWTRVIDRLHRLAAGYEPIKRMMESSPEIGWITKSGGKGSIIPEQIAFLKSLSEMPNIGAWFPEVRGIPSEKDGVVSYEMPYYRMRPLRAAIFAEDDQERAESFAREVLRITLAFCTDDLYSAKVTVKLPASFVEQEYLGRYEKRYARTLDEVKRQRQKRGNTLPLDAYEKLLTAERVLIGGQERRAPSDILREIRNDQGLVAKLAPPFLSLIHGDLHFENILIDDRLPRNLRVKLIDPRGFDRPGYGPGTGDPAYDIGKLFHSSHGLYDFIHAGHLRVRLDDIKYPDAANPETVEVPKLHYEEWVTGPQKGGGSGDVITVHTRTVPSCARAVFATLDRFIRDFFTASAYRERDPHWLLRATLHEALHFCTLGPFHLGDDPVRAIVLHIRGVDLLNAFWDDYKAGRLDIAKTV